MCHTRGHRDHMPHANGRTPIARLCFPYFGGACGPIRPRRRTGDGPPRRLLLPLSGSSSPPLEQKVVSIVCRPRGGFQPPPPPFRYAHTSFGTPKAENVVGTSGGRQGGPTGQNPLKKTSLLKERRFASRGGGCMPTKACPLRPNFLKRL